MIGPNKMWDTVFESAYILSKINETIRIQFIKKIVISVLEFFLKYKLIGLLEGYSIERILYEFAIVAHSISLDSGRLNALKNRVDPNTDFGIDYKIRSNNRETVTGINMLIWTKNNLARLNLDLNIKFGKLVLEVEWCFKNSDGVFERYSRADAILGSRKDIKEILVEQISQHCLYLYKFCEKISPSR